MRWELTDIVLGQDKINVSVNIASRPLKFETCILEIQMDGSVSQNFDISASLFYFIELSHFVQNDLQQGNELIKDTNHPHSVLRVIKNDPKEASLYKQSHWQYGGRRAQKLTLQWTNLWITKAGRWFSWKHDTIRIHEVCLCKIDQFKWPDGTNFWWKSVWITHFPVALTLPRTCQCHCWWEGNGKKLNWYVSQLHIWGTKLIGIMRWTLLFG